MGRRGGRGRKGGGGWKAGGPGRERLRPERGICIVGARQRAVSICTPTGDDIDRARRRIVVVMQEIDASPVRRYVVLGTPVSRGELRHAELDRHAERDAPVGCLAHPDATKATFRSMK